MGELRSQISNLNEGESMSDVPTPYTLFLENPEEREQLRNRLKNVFLDYPAFPDAMTESLSLICLETMGGKKALLTSWDLQIARFSRFWDFGFSEEETVPVPSPSSQVTNAVRNGQSCILLGSEELLKEFGPMSAENALCAYVQLRRHTKALLTVFDIPELDKTPLLGKFLQELANIVGDEIARSLAATIGKRHMETGNYDLSYILLRGQKRVAFMFADIRESTPLTEILSNRKILDKSGKRVMADNLLNDYSERMANAIWIHGRVEKFMGDGIMAVFGDLREEEGDRETVENKIALKAVCAAKRMEAEFKEILKEWHDEWIPNFVKECNEEINPRIGIGINFGPAVFGFYGSTEHKDYSAIGDTVNTAKRLEEQASNPDEQGDECEPILISQTMFSRVSKFVETKKHVVSIRGKKHRMPIYGVTCFYRDKCYELVRCEECEKHPKKCL